MFILARTDQVEVAAQSQMRSQFIQFAIGGGEQGPGRLLVRRLDEEFLKTQGFALKGGGHDEPLLARKTAVF